VKILKVRYYVDDGFRPVCRVDTNEGPVLLNIEALKLRLVWAGFVFVGERSSAAAPRIVLPRKWAGNDSEMTLHGFATDPAIVKIAQGFVEACHTGTFEPGSVPIPTEPPQYVNITSPPCRFRHSIVWPIDGAQTLGSQLVRITRREEP